MKKQNQSSYKEIYGDNYTTVDTANVSAVRESLTGLHDGGSVSFLDDVVDVVEETLESGAKARSFLAKIDGKVSKFFVNWLASKGFPVQVCEDSLEDFQETVKKGIPETNLEGVNNANTGEVVNEWQSFKTLKEALTHVKGRTMKVKAIHWTLGRWDSPEKPRVTYEFSWE